MNEAEVQTQSRNDVVPKVIRFLWRLLVSVELAVVFMLAIAGACIAGAVIPQVPADLAADPALYGAWLENLAYPILGALTSPFSALGLLDIFHSWWFLTLGALLICSLVLSGVRRWLGLRQDMAANLVAPPDMLFTDGNASAGTEMVGTAPEGILSALGGLLRQRKYRVHTGEQAGIPYLSAVKNRYSALGTYFSHLSLLVIVIGLAANSYFGFQNHRFIVAEGTKRDVGYGTGLTLYLRSFLDIYWPDGTPRDYISEVVVLEAGSQAEEGVVRVGHPLNYNGVRFYQSFFGPAAVVRVRDGKGVLIYEDCIPMTRLQPSETVMRPFGTFVLPSVTLFATVVGPAIDGPEPAFKEGQVGFEVYQPGSQEPVAWAIATRSVPLKLADLEFTFVADASYSGFQVTRDPANGVIWLGLGMLVASLCAIFVVPRRRIWAIARAVESGVKFHVRIERGSGRGTALEHHRLAEELRQSLSEASELNNEVPH